MLRHLPVVRSPGGEDKRCAGSGSGAPGVVSISLCANYRIGNDKDGKIDYDVKRDPGELGQSTIYLRWGEE